MVLFLSLSIKQTIPIMEQPTQTYYQLNRGRILAKYAEKKADLIAYQILIEKQQSYNAMYYQKNKTQILLNKTQKVCCLICRRIVAERQMTPHKKTAVCKSNV